MPVPVTIFNASQETISVSVNGGPQFTIAGTGPGQSWQPQQPNPNPLSFTNGYPEPNTFGAMYPNQVLLIVNGMPISEPLHVNIPRNAPIFSLQLYVFFSMTTGVSWVMLSSGQPVASGTSMTMSALKSAFVVKSRGGGSKKSVKGSSKKAGKKR